MVWAGVPVGVGTVKSSPRWQTIWREPSWTSFWRWSRATRSRS